MKKNEINRHFYAKFPKDPPLFAPSDKCKAIAIKHFLSALACGFLIACNTVQTMSDKAAEIALSAAGITIPDNAALPKAPKTIKVRLEAARDLNADEAGQGLSAIVRLYKLKDRNAFMSAQLGAFGNPEKEKQAFGSDLMEMRELTLSPGQTLELSEKMTGEMAYLGVATLFRSPDPKRWRFAFATAEAEPSGITLGLHSCAMTATSAAPSGMDLHEAALLSSVKCK